MSRTEPTDVGEFDIAAFDTFFYQGNLVDPNHIEKLVRSARVGSRHQSYTQHLGC